MEQKQEKIQKYSNVLKVGKVMASILVNMDIELSVAQKLFEDPTDLFDIDSSIYELKEVATALLKQKNRTIKVFADYDVDGLMSGFILNDYLKNILQYDSEVYYPSREEGYGLNTSWIKKMLENHAPEKLTVVTIDNGITAHDPIKLLRNNGAEVYVIDHHEPSETLPDANFICDAWIDKGYGIHLCAAAIAWKLVFEMSLQNNDSAEQISDIMHAYLPYVTLATISDVMPPHTENRAIIQAGLKAINNRQSEVIRALMAVENIDTIRSKDIAWTIAPMLNACSRMNKISVAEKLFQYEGFNNTEIKILAYKIREINKKRKTLTEKAMEKILEENDFDNDPVIFADGTEYSIGLIGILAGKLCELMGRPAVVYHVQDKIGYGSARAPQGIDIKAIINYEATKGNAITALGHAEACGAQILPERIKDFNEDLLASNIVFTADNAAKEETITGISITTKDINPVTKREIDSFGYTSKEIPILILTDVKVEPVVWATASGKKHVIFRLPDKKYAVAWNGYEAYKELGAPKYISFSGSLDSGAFCQYCKDVPINEHSTIFTIDKIL